MSTRNGAASSWIAYQRTVGILLEVTLHNLSIEVNTWSTTVVIPSAIGANSVFFAGFTAWSEVVVARFTSGRGRLESCWKQIKRLFKEREEITPEEVISVELSDDDSIGSSLVEVGRAEELSVEDSVGCALVEMV